MARRMVVPLGSAASVVVLADLTAQLASVEKMEPSALPAWFS